MVVPLDVPFPSSSGLDPPTSHALSAAMSIHQVLLGGANVVSCYRTLDDAARALDAAAHFLGNIMGNAVGAERIFLEHVRASEDRAARVESHLTTQIARADEAVARAVEARDNARRDLWSHQGRRDEERRRIAHFRLDFNDRYASLHSFNQQYHAAALEWHERAAQHVPIVQPPAVQVPQPTGMDDDENMEDGGASSSGSEPV